MNDRAQHCQFNARHPVVLHDIQEILNYLSCHIIDTYHLCVKLCITKCFNQNCHCQVMCHYRNINHPAAQL